MKKMIAPAAAAMLALLKKVLFMINVKIGLMRVADFNNLPEHERKCDGRDGVEQKEDEHHAVVGEAGEFGDLDGVGE
jgi:hypothetical protein